MSEIPDEYEEKVASYAESNGIDVDEAEEFYVNAFEEVKEHFEDEDISSDRAARIAYSTYRSDVLDHVSGGGSLVNILAVGHTGVRMWPIRDSDGNLVDSNGNHVDNRDDADKKEVLVAQGIVDAPIDDMDPGPVSLILDSTNGVDLDHAMHLFRPLTGVKGKFRIDEVDSMTNAYIGWSTNSTDLAEEYEEFPDDKETLRGVLHKNTEKAEIAHIEDFFSATELVDGTRRTAGFGVDIKRIEGNIADYYISDDGDMATYTIIDQSIEPEDIEDDERIVGENQRTPGLTLWSTEDKMEYGKGTEAEFYGPIRKNQESGQITMNLSGIIPIFPRPLDNGSQSSKNTETDTF